MVWLVSHMWVLVAGTGFLAFVFGLGLRGLMLRGKLRRTEVERDVAMTELEQARSEIEALYGAQRKLRGEGDAAEGARLREELAAREEKLARLTSELSRSKEELDALKASASSSTKGAEPAAPSPASADAAEGTIGDATAMSWRNRYLESRVRYLEERVQSLANTPPAEAPGVQAGAAEPAPATADVDDAKARWQLDYLKTRVRVLEDKVARQAEQGGQGGGPAAAPEAAARTETVDEELARLRWRNRYLEGRLAYLEESAEPEGAAPSDINGEGDREAAALAADFAEAPVPDAVIGPADDAQDEVQAAEAGESEPDLADDPKAYVYRPTLTGNDGLGADEVVPGDDGTDAATAMLAELDDSGQADPALEGFAPTRPDSLEKPRGGRGDDLSEIQGVGPRIQDALNGLGIFHFDQVAAWTPENEAWIDDYLNFAGRVARERWVEQARVLADRS